jgi:hypothetical protein
MSEHSTQMRERVGDNGTDILSVPFGSEGDQVAVIDVAVSSPRIARPVWGAEPISSVVHRPSLEDHHAAGVP